MMTHKALNGHNNAMSKNCGMFLSSISGSLIVLLLAGSLIFISACATAKVNVEEPPKPVISKIEIADNAVIIAADQPFKYTMYKPGDPYKVIVDIPDALIGAFDKKIVSRKRGITEIVPSQVNSPSLLARIEILLETPLAVDQEYGNNLLTIKVKDDASPRLASARQQEPPKELRIPDPDKKERTAPAVKPDINRAPDAQPQLPKATEITNISFDTSANYVKLLIRGNGLMTPNVIPVENRLVLDIPDVILNAAVPAGVVSPVKGIRSGRHDNKTRIVIDLKEMTKFDVAADGDSVIVTVKRDKEPLMLAAPLAEKNAGSPAERIPGVRETERNAGNICWSYIEGRENINFDFQDQDIVPIFRLFADISGCNLFVHPDVKGRATMKFIDVSWSQALDTILSTFSLGKSVEGNIIRIAPHTVFQKESEEKAKAREALTLAEPLHAKIFNISYAKVKDVDAAVKSAKLLSPRGSTSTDERTSTILVQDTAAVFPKVENLLATLDKPIPQVLIEARIVEVSTTGEINLGIQWGLNFNASNTLSSIGGLTGLNKGPFTGGNYLVDFPAAAKGSGIQFGVLSPDRTLGIDLQLSALELVSKGKIISNPRILTTDNVPAKIMQGESVPYTQPSTEAGGKDTTAFKDVAISIEVTPHITPANSVLMTIKTTKEELIEFIALSSGAAPRTSKIEANTQVLIQDGETIVIGGMYKKVDRSGSAGVPGLMHVPVLGWLFKNKRVTEDVRELMIFITPRIAGKP